MSGVVTTRCCMAETMPDDHGDLNNVPVRGQPTPTSADSRRLPRRTADAYLGGQPRSCLEEAQGGDLTDDGHGRRLNAGSG
jgi:hypothetical protein